MKRDGEQSNEPKQSMYGPSEEMKERINWPKTNSREWEHLDTDLTMLLRDIGGTAEKKAEVHPKVIHSFCLERFGPVKKKARQGEIRKGLSHRQKKGITLRKK